MKIKIKHFINGSVLFECDKDSLKLAVELAVNQKADLRGAYLSGAYLRGAYLRGADLSGAYLRGAYLRGAYLRGADLSLEKLDKAPIQILELKWDVLITKQHMKIGCEFHKAEEWWKFDNKRIAQMAGKEALVFWKANKLILKKLWENHCK